MGRGNRRSRKGLHGRRMLWLRLPLVLRSWLCRTRLTSGRNAHLFEVMLEKQFLMLCVPAVSLGWQDRQFKGQEVRKEPL